MKNNNTHCKFNLKKDSDENIKLLGEKIDNLNHISDKHFVIVSYNDINNLSKISITSKFKNEVEISENIDILKKRKQNKDDSKFSFMTIITHMLIQ